MIEAARQGADSMPVRYMGTKRYLAPRVRELVNSIDPAGPVVDLFSGIGAVASALAPKYHVITNDALSFTVPLARARFGASQRSKLADLLPGIQKLYRECEGQLRSQHRKTLAGEAAAMDGDWQGLANWMSGYEHVGNSVGLRALATKLGTSNDSSRYRLVTLYFAGGYFGTLQAIQLDAIRYAIDHYDGRPGDRDWALAAWVSAAATVVNAPGHTAQYLRVSSESTLARVRRSWVRNVWSVFIDRLADLVPEGTYRWRAGNRFLLSEALDLLGSKKLRRVGCVYADPPYTKDHYSRYYHLYETMHKYDFPDSVGKGRYRSDRFVTQFSIKTKVASAFESLIAQSLRLDVPLVLSYPEAGLLAQTGIQLRELLGAHFGQVEVKSFEHEHSTLGASGGRSKKETMENIYVCTPRIK